MTPQSSIAATDPIQAANQCVQCVTAAAKLSSHDEEPVSQGSGCMGERRARRDAFHADAFPADAFHADAFRA